MNTKLDLVGKTISGVVAARDGDDGPHRIWMLQFTDGTHVEFVSPVARRQLAKLTGASRMSRKHRMADPQLALNVA